VCVCERERGRKGERERLWKWVVLVVCCVFVCRYLHVHTLVHMCLHINQARVSKIKATSLLGACVCVSVCLCVGMFVCVCVFV